MKLSAKGLYYVLIGVIGLAFAVLALCTYAANDLLQKKSQSVLEAKTKGLVLDEKQRRLTKAKVDIAKYRELSDIAKHIVPQDKDQAQTVREIVALAAANGIKLGAITFPTSSLGDAKQPLSQLKPVKNIPGVYSLDITVQSDSKSPAAFSSFVAFLDALEHNRRTALVDSISIQPDLANPAKLSFTLVLKEHIKP